MLNKYEPHADLYGVLPHQDLSAIREFEHDRKPICPSEVMAVKGQSLDYFGITLLV